MWKLFVQIWKFFHFKWPQLFRFSASKKEKKWKISPTKSQETGKMSFLFEEISRSKGKNLASEIPHKKEEVQVPILFQIEEFGSVQKQNLPRSDV